MKQHIIVRAIVYNRKGQILLCKRAHGSDDVKGKYELPGGEITYGEQPEDTLKRYLGDMINIDARPAKLIDAVMLRDDSGAVEYLVLLYTTTLQGGGRELHEDGKYIRYQWCKLEKTQRLSLTKESSDMMSILQHSFSTDIEHHDGLKPEDENTTEPNSVVVYTDGGSRGNPGPSSAGYVIVSQQGDVVAQGGKYLGITTSSQAEYQGVLLGLEKALELRLRVLEFRIDSMLVVNQLNGTYYVKNRELWPVFERIRRTIGLFDVVRFRHIPREQNVFADGLVNHVLDSRTPHSRV